ncbi:MAG: DoxX family protein [Cyclobacteriaceae bacterium]
MNKFKNTDLGLLLLRLSVGWFMIYGHGWGKLMKLFGDGPIKFGDPLGLGPELSLFLAVFAEVLCSIFLMLGLFTRQALIPLIITMLTAILFVHLGDPFGRLEKALMYLLPYIALFFTGPGRYSFDAILRKVNV